jgi:hypothetical protein
MYEGAGRSPSAAAGGDTLTPLALVIPSEAARLCRSRAVRGRAAKFEESAVRLCLIGLEGFNVAPGASARQPLTSISDLNLTH